MVTRTPESSVTVADPVMFELDCNVAITVITVGVTGVVLFTGTDKGAVYSPPVLIVPTVVLPLVMSFTDHVTAAPLLTVAVNCVVVPTKSVVEDGESEMLTF